MCRRDWRQPHTYLPRGRRARSSPDATHCVVSLRPVTHRQVATFLREHPREVVLLDLQHVRAAPTAEAHAKLLGQARAALPDPRRGRRLAARSSAVRPAAPANRSRSTWRR